jgi:hypothetical protein
MSEWMPNQERNMPSKTSHFIQREMALQSRVIHYKLRHSKLFFADRGSVESWRNFEVLAFLSSAKNTIEQPRFTKGERGGVIGHSSYNIAQKSSDRDTGEVLRP